MVCLPNGEFDPDTGNLVVRGNNLVALKALLSYYLGRSIASALSRHSTRATKAKPSI
jgi:hypothetical protein